MAELPTPDENDIGRYGESAPAVPSAAAGGFSEYLNKALRDISAAISRLTRTNTMYRRAAATIASSGSYQALDHPTSVMGSAFSQSAGVFTCVTAGTYRVLLLASFAGNATGSRGVRLAGAGSVPTRTTPLATSGLSATLDAHMMAALVHTFAAGETFTAQALQSSGGALAVSSEVTIERLY